MQLKKYEQSGFILETGKGFKLAFDIGTYTPVGKLEGITVDAMIVSHIHGDHFSFDQIKALAPKKLYLNTECIEVLSEETLVSAIVTVKDGDTVQIDEITVQLFNVDHGPNTTVVPKENFGFLIKADGETVYFAGDMFYPSGIDVSNLEVDTALIPVGTHYTFGPEEALAFVKQFKKIGKIIPMHYNKKPETSRQFVALAKVVGFNAE